jgi:hypothetical protein
VTTIVSILGFIGRAVGSVLASSLGWATGLLYGRVPKDHQKYVELMLGASIAWAFLLVVALVPAVGAFVRTTTPGATSVGGAVLRTLILAALILLPAVVGIAGWLVPAEAQRATGVETLLQIGRGYGLAVLIAALAVFLPLAGAARRIGSLRRGWSDSHLAVIVKTDGYDTVVKDVRSALEEAGFALTPERTPRLLEVPGRLLALIAGKDVASSVPDRLVELRGENLEVGIYPSDVSISGRAEDRLRARSILLPCLATTAVHFTASAESQRIEDRLERLSRAKPAKAKAMVELAEIDADLRQLDVPEDEWEVLYRLRLEAECAVLRRSSGRAGHAAA